MYFPFPYMWSCGHGLQLPYDLLTTSPYLYKNEDRLNRIVENSDYENVVTGFIFHIWEADVT